MVVNITESNTAAERLLRIARDVTATNQNESLLKMWARVLKLPGDERLIVFGGILALAKLIGDVETTVSRHAGGAAALYERSFECFRRALSVSLDTQRSAFDNDALKRMVVDFEHCVVLYAGIEQEAVVTQAALQSLRDQITDLFEEISQAEIPSELRTQLLDLLEVMRLQMAQYEIRGAAVLRECLRQALSRLLEVYPSLQEHSHLAVIKKLAAVVRDIETLAKGAKVASALASAAARKLLPFIWTTEASASVARVIDVGTAQ